MENVTYRAENGRLLITLSGHIDSTNADEVENAVNQARCAVPSEHVVLDCEHLKYTSSAGLRVILRLKKEVADTRLINVSSEVYEIFEMTGFSEIMDIEKACRVLSVDGCEVIGQGANGSVYRIDRDTIVKVYNNPDALPEIRRERELARTAFVSGVPTAIPFDVVKIRGGGYGSVFELLNAKSFASLLISKEKTIDEVAKMSIDLLKTIHGTVVTPGSMPDMKAVALNWTLFLKDYLPADRFEKLHALVDAVPEDHHMMHGDYHIKNVMLQNGESLLIDMDTLCYGHPVFELASMYNAYAGFAETDHSVSESFLGIPYEVSVDFWHRSLRLYLDGADDTRIKEVEEKAMIVGYARMMRRSIRRGGPETEAGKREIENCRIRLDRLLESTDTLLF